MGVWHRISADFDDPNLLGVAGLVPVVALAERAGLHQPTRARDRARVGGGQRGGEGHRGGRGDGGRCGQLRGPGSAAARGDGPGVPRLGCCARMGRTAMSTAPVTAPAASAAAASAAEVAATSTAAAAGPMTPALL